MCTSYSWGQPYAQKWILQKTWLVHVPDERPAVNKLVTPIHLVLLPSLDDMSFSVKASTAINGARSGRGIPILHRREAMHTAEVG
jgi:hypothetical protein